jgi:small subunit ribosomal protein S21
MLIVKVNEGESIERALKKFKRKEQQTKLVKELRNRKEYVKPSVARREKMKKAVYANKFRLENEN